MRYFPFGRIERSTQQIARDRWISRIFLFRPLSEAIKAAKN
jgi:hypothetical protein